MLYLFTGGRGNIGQGIVDAQLLPLEQAKGVIGQYLGLLHIGECVEELAKAAQLFIIIGDAWHEYVADPYGLACVAQIAGTVEYVVIGMACEPAVLLAVDVFDVEQYQVGTLHEALELREERLLS